MDIAYGRNSICNAPRLREHDGVVAVTAPMRRGIFPAYVAETDRKVLLLRLFVGNGLDHQPVTEPVLQDQFQHSNLRFEMIETGRTERMASQRTHWRCGVPVDCTSACRLQRHPG